MKKNIKIYSKGKYVNKQITYIPTRYIWAILFAVLQIAAVIGIMALMAMYVPYFYIVIFATEIISIVTIVVSSGNPDYKVTWLFFVVMLPLVGLVLFLMFHKRKLPKKATKRIKKFYDTYDYNDTQNMAELKANNPLLATQAQSLCKTANTHLYKNTQTKYYALGEDMYKDMLTALNKAKNFIFLEYFIIEEGEFWTSILDILKQKVEQGVEVKLIYDDIGCMGTLPGNYYKKLKKKYGIDAVLFSKLKGHVDGEFNNRSHRKILVIDGRVGFTGGINIADEYINKKVRLGHWKDTGIKLEGLAVNELTKLFLSDFYINKKQENQIDFNKYYLADENNIVEKNNNYVIPFGDGPRPIYEYDISKMAIMNLLNQAQKYVYITTPYLVVDNEVLSAIKNTAMRGVDVRIIVPHIPDKKFVFEMTKNSYIQLFHYGVKVYEYTPGFIHAKSYIADDNVGIIGTINLDYRSLNHHFENGVWINDEKIILEIKQDFLDTQNKSEYMNDKKQKSKLFIKLFNVIVKLFSPLL